MKIDNKLNVEPLVLLKSYYKKAIARNQKYIEAACISSHDKKSNMVNSRYVNIKHIYNTNFIFFSNYNSMKAKEFISNQNVALNFFGIQ